MPNSQVRIDSAAIEAWRKRHPDQEHRSLKHILESLLWNDYPKTIVESAIDSASCSTEEPSKSSHLPIVQLEQTELGLNAVDVEDLSPDDLDLD